MTHYFNWIGKGDEGNPGTTGTKAFKGVPIIALTSSGRRGDGKICKDIGIDGYLTKQIRRDDLHMAIISVLGLSIEKD